MSRKKSAECPRMPRLPATWFASPERATEAALRADVRRISSSPVVSFALEMLGGWLAILNEHRQILAMNHALLHALGVDEPGRMLGMRPGEVLHCVHAQDHPAGCGTSRFCGSCGAAISMVAAFETGQSQERECILTADGNGALVDRVFAVRSCPFEMDGHKLLLISMKDVSDERHRMALERTFLHDLGNTLLGLSATVDMLESADGKRLSLVRRATSSLMRELRVQRLLARDGAYAHLERARVRPSQILAELKDLMIERAEAAGQKLLFRQTGSDEPWETDAGLLMRVLTNMVVNALEAGQVGDEVRVGAETTAQAVAFHVQNRQVIPEKVAWRIFQRYFSTKSGDGRGLGTFTMKLLGEKLLGGQVGFTSTPADGTMFSIRLACTPGHAGPADRGASGNGKTQHNRTGRACKSAARKPNRHARQSHP